jgi:hypothetical protein
MNNLKIVDKDGNPIAEYNPSSLEDKYMTEEDFLGWCAEQGITCMSDCDALAQQLGVHLEYSPPDEEGRLIMRKLLSLMTENKDCFDGMAEFWHEAYSEELPLDQFNKLLIKLRRVVMIGTAYIDLDKLKPNQFQG